MRVEGGAGCTRRFLVFGGFSFHAFFMFTSQNEDAAVFVLSAQVKTEKIVSVASKTATSKMPFQKLRGKIRQRQGTTPKGSHPWRQSTSLIVNLQRLIRMNLK